MAGAAADAVIEIIGTGQSGPALALRTFLNRNTIAYHWVDVGQPDEAADILGSAGATRDDLPVVIAHPRGDERGPGRAGGGAGPWPLPSRAAL